MNSENNKQQNEPFKSFFPGLIHWSLLPGMIFFAATALGISGAFQIPFGWLHAPIPKPGIPLWLCIGGCAALAFIGIFTRIRPLRFFAFLFLAAWLTLMHRNEQRETYEALQRIVNRDPVPEFHGKVIAPPAFFYENFIFLLKIDSIAGDHLNQWRGKTIQCISPYEPPTYGRIKLRGNFNPPEFRQNPYAYNEYSAMMAAGLWGTVTVKESSIIGITPTLADRVSGGFRKITLDALNKITDYDNRALLLAAFFGDTKYLSPYIKEVFRQSGIYHLIAVSGLNTAMLTIALYFLLRLLRVRPLPSHLICLAALWMYQLYVGMVPSLFRATIMASFIIISLLFEKKNYPFHTIGLAGAIWLLLSPESLFLPGFQLSYAATAGLLGIVPILSSYVPDLENKFAKNTLAVIASSLSISVVSFAVTAPILLYHFGTISFFGLLANLVAVAAMTVSMWAFFAGLLLQMTIPVITTVPLWIAERFMDIVVTTGKAATLVPWSQASFPSPTPETIIAIAIFFVGLATVNKARLGRYGIVSGIIICCAIPIHHFYYRWANHVEVVHFSDGKNSIGGVKWPDQKLWFIVPKSKDSLSPLFCYHITPWLRHRAYGTVEVIITPFEQLAETTELIKILPQKNTPRIIPYGEQPGLPAHVPFLIDTPAKDCAISLTKDSARSGIIAAISFHGRVAQLYLFKSTPRQRKKEAGYPSEPFRGTNYNSFRVYSKRIIAKNNAPAGHPLSGWK